MTAERTNRADADVTAEQIAPVAQTIASPVDHAGAKLTAFFRRARHQPAEPSQLHTASTKMAKSATKSARGETVDIPATSASETSVPTTANDIPPRGAIKTDNGEDDTSMAESAPVKQQEGAESDYSDNNS